MTWQFAVFLGTTGGQWAALDSLLSRVLQCESALTLCPQGQCASLKHRD